MFIYKFRDSLFSSFAIAFVMSLSFEASAEESNSSKTKILPKVTVTANADDFESENIADGYKAESISSATRTNTKLIDVPQAVSVVTQEQIRDQNITTMEEASRYVPGVNVQMGEGHRDQITIRGMNNGSKGTTSNFFIDGSRDDAEYIRDFYNIERIEFLKGPNAMAFGRGSPGGVVNRVSKFADGARRRGLVLSGGSFENRRAEADIGDNVNENFALRLNSMYQKSNSYRRYAEFERYAFNPTATVDLGKNTELRFGYEHFQDERFPDRGIPSQNGVAYVTDPSSFFGNPNENKANATINSTYATLIHDFDKSLNLKNHIRYTTNHKFYQNVVPGAISGDSVTLTAYNAKQERNNFTNQTDIVKKFTTGSMKHKTLIGSEITVQDSTKVKTNGTFSDTGTTSTTVSLSNPFNYSSISYDSIANNNESDVEVYAGYIQDQIDVNEYLQLTAGMRVDRFAINFQDIENNQDFKRIDVMYSPRAGIVVKPQESVSIYGSYSVTYLPSSGDQFDSLSVTTSALKPEKFQNYEVGTKWDVTPKLNLSTALYQIDRTRTPADDPDGSGYLVLTGESRTRGIELSATGKITDRWQTIAGYAFQDAEVTSTTENATKGAKVALVPHNTFSLWNKYDFTNQWAGALGIISQSDQFAAADNTVRLKGFTRFDAAAYYRINPDYRMQLNVENIFDRGYIQTAHSNNNILPGSPRAFKLSLVANF